MLISATLPVDHDRIKREKEWSKLYKHYKGAEQMKFCTIWFISQFELEMVFLILIA